MTGYVDRINTANQGMDRNMTRLPANWAGKSHCDTVEPRLLKQNYPMMIFVDGRKGQFLVLT